MSPKLVALIIDIVLVALVLLGFLFGLRGLKKATGSLVSFIVNLAVVFLLGPWVSSLVLKIKFGGSTLNDRIMNFVNSLIGDSMASNATVQEVVKNIPLLLVDIVVTMILIIILGLIFKGIGALVFRIIWGKNKEKVVEKCEIVNGTPQMVKTTIKPKKHRLAGGLIGACHGFLFAVALFFPLFGLANIFEDLSGTSSASAEYSQAFEIKELDELLHDHLPQEVFEYSKAINGTVFAKIGKVGNLSEATLNFVSRCTINGQTIRLGTEIRSFAKTYETFLDFVKTSTSNLGNFSLTTIINDIINNPDNYDFDKLYNTVDTFFESKLVVALGNDVLEMAVDKFSEITTQSNMSDYLSYFKKAVVSYNASNGDLKNDIKAIIGTLEISAKSGLIKEFKQKPINLESIKAILFNPADASTGKAENEYLNKLCEKVSSCNLLQKIILETTNYSLSQFELKLNDSLEFKDNYVISLNRIDSTKDYKLTKDNLVDIITQAVDCYEAIKSVDIDALKNDFYVIFDGDISSLIVSVGEGLDLVVSLPMFNQTGLFESFCNALANSTYSDYINFNALKTGNDIKAQFTKLSYSVDELIDSGVIGVLREMTDENRNEQINNIIAKLSLKVENKTRANRILSPILGCEVFKNSIIYGLNYGHDVLENNLKQLNANTSLSEFNTSDILTERENEQFLSVIDNLIAYCKDIKLEDLEGDKLLTTLLNSDLSLLGNALDSIKNSTLFAPYDNFNGTYNDLIDAMMGTTFADNVLFEVAKAQNFVWNNDLSKISELINNLSEIKIDGENVIIYLVNGGNYVDAVDAIKNATDGIKPLYESALLRPVAAKVINTINDKIKDFVGEDLSTDILSVASGTNLSSQAQEIVNIIKCALDIDFGNTDIAEFDVQKIDALFDALNANAENDGVFKQSYNSMLLKLTNLINSNIKDLVGEENAGNINTFNEVVDVLQSQEQIRNVIKTAINNANKFNDKKLKEIDTSSLFDFIDKFNTDCANGAFEQTYNALLVYCVNTVNSTIFDSIGESYAKLNADENNMTTEAQNIKNVLEVAKEAYISLGDGENLKDLDEEVLNSLCDALDACEYTKETKTKLEQYIQED